MSAILKALEKIERRQSSAAGTLQTAAKGAASQQDSRSRSVSWILWTLLGGLLLGSLLTVWGVRLWRPVIPAVPQAGSQQKVAEAKIDPQAAQEALSTPPGNDADAGRHTAVKNASRQTEPLSVPVPARDKSAPAGPPLVSSKPLQVEPTMPSKPAPAVPAQTQTAARPIQKAPVLPTPTPLLQAPETPAAAEPVDRFENAQPLAGSQLSLQAVVWSPTAAKRMVVVNGQILREGGRIDGYEIALIGKQGLVATKNGRDWRLELRDP